VNRDNARDVILERVQSALSICVIRLVGHQGGRTRMKCGMQWADRRGKIGDGRGLRVLVTSPVAGLYARVYYVIQHQLREDTESNGKDDLGL
jgi:hypothetical protein